MGFFMFYKIFLFSFIFCFILGIAAYAKPITSLKEVSEIIFGTIIPDPDGDTITISPSGNITSNSGSTFFAGNTSAASFTGKGDKNASYFISFSAGDSMTGTGANMTIQNFTHDAGITPSTDARGNFSFNVGTSLIINPGQISGEYSGVYTVFVDYP